MSLKKFGKVSLVAMAVGLAGCASQPPQHYSGFLGDYSQLKESTDSTGGTVARAVNPAFNPKNYSAALIDPVIFYPEPQPSEKVSMSDLDAIRAYLNQTLHNQIGKSVPVVDRAGPGVLRLRVAITAVSTEKEGLKAYQYIPIAFVVTQVTNAATSAPEQAKLSIETELTDSVSGVRMMSAVRTGAGEGLRPSSDNAGKFAVDSLKPMLDEWGKFVAAEAPKYVQGKR